jgi:hypothetical protein
MLSSRLYPLGRYCERNFYLFIDELGRIYAHNHSLLPRAPDFDRALELLLLGKNWKLANSLCRGHPGFRGKGNLTSEFSLAVLLLSGIRFECGHLWWTPDSEPEFMMDQEQVRVQSTVRQAIAELESVHLRDQLLAGLITPVRERRTYPTGHGETQGDLWIFYVIPGRDIALAYSEDGYGLSGLHWGLIGTTSRESRGYGSSGNWSSSFEALLEDSGHFEDE